MPLSEQVKINKDNLEYKLVTDDSEMKAALEVRRRVFVEEQGISEKLEMDGDGPEVLYMVVINNKEIVGTARIKFLADQRAKLERMAVIKQLRGAGIGRRIVSFLNEELKKMGREQIILHAQYPVIAFYRSCGFQETGLPFLEAGIKHIKMEKKV